MMMIKAHISLCLDSVHNDAVVNSTSLGWYRLQMSPYYERESFGKEDPMVLSVQ